MPLDHLYMTKFGLTVYGAAYLPLTLLISWFIYRKWMQKLSKLWLRGMLMVIMTSVLVTIPFWDVLAIGIEAKQLCTKQAGLHVYRTAETDGFVGGGIGYWSKYGFTYTETGGYRGAKFRHTMKDGKEAKEQVSDYISHYALQVGVDAKEIGKYFIRKSDRVVNLETKEVLGELVTFMIFPGRLDRTVTGIAGIESTPWLCGYEPPADRPERLSHRDVVLATLKPRNTSEGEFK